MNVFVLEDRGHRVNYFMEKFLKDNLCVCNNVDMAKLMLKQIKFDCILLDHDLGGDVYCNSDDENTGYQIAKFIPDTINRDSQIIIHSWNVPAGEKMYLELKMKDSLVYRVLFDEVQIDEIINQIKNGE